MRTPPYSNDAETSLLGCILLSPNDCLDDLISKHGDSLKDFCYDLRKQLILDEIIRMHTETIPVEPHTLIQRLREKGNLEQVGGIAEIASLPDKVPSASAFDYYADILRDKMILRKTIRHCEESIESIYNSTDGADAILDRFEAEALAIRPIAVESNETPSLVRKALEKIERLSMTDGISGLSTGLSDLDRTTDGLHDGEMIIISGYPSTGKTSLAINIAQYNFMNGIPVGIASAETLPEGLIERCIYSAARINKNDLRFKRLNHGDLDRIALWSGKIAKAPVHIANSCGHSIQQVAATARRMKQKHGIKLFVIDYLQRLTCDGDNREREIAGISAGAKNIANELGIPVILLSQLNDDGQIRESRAPVHDTDSLWKLSNKGDWLPDNQPVDLFIEKSRDNEAGISVELLFKKAYTKFECAAVITDDDVPKQAAKD